MHVSFKYSLTFAALATLSLGAVAVGGDNKFIKQPSLKTSKINIEKTASTGAVRNSTTQQPSFKSITQPTAVPSSDQPTALVEPQSRMTRTGLGIQQASRIFEPNRQFRKDPAERLRNHESMQDTSSASPTPQKLNWVTTASPTSIASSQQFIEPKRRFASSQVNPGAQQRILGDIIATQRELAIQDQADLRWSRPIAEPPRANNGKPAAEASMPADLATAPTNTEVSQTPAEAIVQRRPPQLVLPKDYHTSMPNVQVLRDLAEKSERQQLASLVSHQIVGSSVSHEQVAVDPMHAPAGWSAIRGQLLTHVSRCEALLRKRAFFSAREEAERGITYLAQVLDGMENRYHCEPAWSAARLALEESEDFLNTERTSTNPNFLRHLIDSHETPVLRTAADLELAPATAAQRYRFYAECCLMEAAQNHTWASDLFYSVGRSYQAQSDFADGNKRLLRWRAISFYRAAVGIDKTNTLAACNLGFCLLQMGLDQEAHQVLLDASKVRPDADVLRNLVESSRRLGDKANMQLALTSLRTLPKAIGNQPRATVIQEVPDWQFQAMSPRSASPAAASNPPSGPVRTASAPSPGR